MKIALGVTLAIAIAIGVATREAAAGTPAFWLGLGVPYLLLSVFALLRLHGDGTLRNVFRFRSGDLTIGILLGGLLFGGAWLGQRLLFGSFSPKMAWVFRLALELDVGHASRWLLAGIAGIAALEELVWRGLVLGSLSDALGGRRAWPLCAALYAAAHLPTLFTLSDPSAGKNPIVVIAALGCGLVWSFVMSLVGRLPPLVVSHAVFTYFAVTVLLPRIG